MKEDCGRPAQTGPRSPTRGMAPGGGGGPLEEGIPGVEFRVRGLGLGVYGFKVQGFRV